MKPSLSPCYSPKRGLRARSKIPFPTQGDLPSFQCGILHLSWSHDKHFFECPSSSLWYYLKLVKRKEVACSQLKCILYFSSTAVVVHSCSFPHAKLDDRLGNSKYTKNDILFNQREVVHTFIDWPRKQQQWPRQQQQYHFSSIGSTQWRPGKRALVGAG